MSLSNVEFKVSVCICSYNHAPYLPFAIDSILSQTYPVYELIIVDDGSTDDSLEIARQYASSNPIIKVYTHPDNSNRGISATANCAFQKVTGDFICWLGSDDVWRVDKIERQIEVIAQNSGIGLIYSLAAIIDAHGELDGRVIGEGLNGEQLAALLRWNVIPALTVMFRRACLSDTGLLSEDVLYSDWELWIKIATCWEVKFINEVLAEYRVHGSNASLGMSQDVDINRKIGVLKELAKSVNTRSGLLLNSKYKATLLQALDRAQDDLLRAYFDGYYQSCQQGRLKHALGYLCKAVSSRPLEATQPRRLASLAKYFVVGATGGR